MRYRNTRSGQIVERPAEDEWLEASAGWERVDATPYLCPDCELPSCEGAACDNEGEED